MLASLHKAVDALLAPTQRFASVLMVMLLMARAACVSGFIVDIVLA